MPHEKHNLIFDAIRQGNMDQLHQLVTSERTANELDSWGQHPLVLASALGRADAVHWLLDHDAAIDSTSGLASLSPAYEARAKTETSDRLAYFLEESGSKDDDQLPSPSTSSGTTPRLGSPLQSPIGKVSAGLHRPETENESSLAAACRTGQESMVDLLISRGASTEARHWSQTPPLVYAAEKGSPAIVRQLLTAGACPDTQFEFSPLMTASMEGHTAIMKQLLNAGADPNLPDDEGFTPLMAASSNGNLDGVRCLVRAGADRDATSDGLDPMTCAQEAGHQSVLLYLRSQSHTATQTLSEVPPMNTLPIRPNGSETSSGSAAQVRQSDFLASALAGDLLGIREGIDSNVPIDTIGVEGYSALMCAASNGHIEIVDWLVAHDASVDLGATYGSADSQAALSGILGRDNGATALGLAASSCFCSDRPAILQRLAKAGADINATDAAGNTPLLRAVTHGMLNSCETLVELGASLDVCDLEGNTALMLAVLCENKQIETILRTVGATEDGLQNIYLCNAVERGDLKKVRALIESGADVNHRGDTTPLVLAVGTRRLEMVEYLIESGADPNRPAEPGGFTAIARAAYGGDSAVVQYLISIGADPHQSVLASYDAIQYARLGAAEGRGTMECYDEIESLLMRKAS